MTAISTDLLLAFDLRERDIVENLPDDRIQFGPIDHVRFYPSPPSLDIDSKWIARQKASGTRECVCKSRVRFTVIDLTDASIEVDKGEFTIRTSQGQVFTIKRPYESMGYERDGYDP